VRFQSETPSHLEFLRVPAPFRFVNSPVVSFLRCRVAQFALRRVALALAASTGLFATVRGRLTTLHPPFTNSPLRWGKPLA